MGGSSSAKRRRDAGATPSAVVSRPAKAARVTEQGEVSIVAGKAVAGSGGAGGGGGSGAATTEVCGDGKTFGFVGCLFFSVCALSLSLCRGSLGRLSCVCGVLAV